jgi:hypothetical protein
MIKKHKIRFNLGRGVNYEKWKITYPDESVKYFEPSDVTIVMKDCFLRNQKGTANKIYNGDNKNVCAWIEAKQVEVINNSDIEYKTIDHIRYNPKVNPFWTINGVNSDGEVIVEIVSIGRDLFSI